MQTTDFQSDAVVSPLCQDYFLTQNLYSAKQRTALHQQKTKIHIKRAIAIIKFPCYIESSKQEVAAQAIVTSDSRCSRILSCHLATFLLHICHTPHHSKLLISKVCCSTECCIISTVLDAKNLYTRSTVPKIARAHSTIPYNILTIYCCYNDTQRRHRPASLLWNIGILWYPLTPAPLSTLT